MKPDSARREGCERLSCSKQKKHTNGVLLSILAIVRTIRWHRVHVIVKFCTFLPICTKREVPSMREMPITAMRDEFAETVRSVEYRSERIVLTRHGKPAAALVSAADLELLEALEDRADLELVRAALAESDERIPYDQVRVDLGLS